MSRPTPDGVLVTLIDDGEGGADPRLGSGLRGLAERLLGEAGHTVVAQVGDARQLVEAVNRERPDLALADVRMPPTWTDDGARAVVALRQRFPDLAVLVLSQHVAPGIVAALAGGRAWGLGYLLKDRVLDSEEFLEQLASVAAGGTVIDPAVVEGVVRRRGGLLDALSARETEVLGLVAAGRSNPGIAAELVISRRTVDAHLRSIFDKLDLVAEPDGNQRVLAVLRWLAGVPTGGGPPGR